MKIDLYDILVFSACGVMLVVGYLFIKQVGGVEYAPQYANGACFVDQGIFTEGGLYEVEPVAHQEGNKYLVRIKKVDAGGEY